MSMSSGLPACVRVVGSRLPLIVCVLLILLLPRAASAQSPSLGRLTILAPAPPRNQSWTATVTLEGASGVQRSYPLKGAAYNQFSASVLLRPGTYTVALEPAMEWAPPQTVSVSAGHSFQIVFIQPERPKQRFTVHWRVHHPDGTPWSNRRFDSNFATDQHGVFRQPPQDDPVYGPRFAPVVLHDDELHHDVLIELGDDYATALVDQTTEWRFRFPDADFESQLFDSFQTGQDHEGLSVLPALYVRALLATDRLPGNEHSRVQMQMQAGFQLPLFGETWSNGDVGSTSFMAHGRPDPFDDPYRERELASWTRRALNGAAVSLAGNLRFALADSDAADAGRPLSALLALKWRFTDGAVGQAGSHGVEASFLLPFDALRDHRGEDVDGIVDVSFHAGGMEFFLGFRTWFSLGRAFGPDAFTRYRMRLEVAFFFVSVGFDMELRWHDAQRLGGEERYGLLVGFGGLAHSVSVLFDFRLGGQIGDAFRFGIGIPFM